MLNARSGLFLAGISGFFAVALGAFGAHGLKSVLSETLMQVYHTAVLYHFIHTLALFGIALWMTLSTHALLKWAATAMLGGIVLFSGSLYLLAVTGVGILGVITPIGGVAFLMGWALIAIAALKNTSA